MSNDFNGTLKYLDISRARVATEAEALANQRPFDKYYGIEQTRPIKKLPGSFTIPEHTQGFSIIPASHVAFQYNYSLTDDFYILNAHKIFNFIDPSLESCFLCVRFRVGTDVTRYQLAGVNQDWLYVEQYNQHLIKANFVIEVWKRPLIVGAVSVNRDIEIITSLLFNPETVEQKDSISLEDDPTLVEEELFVDLPEDIPTDYDDLGPWLTN